ncbi:peptidylprolyl isomerase [Nitrospina watsonii]|uniref:PpiC domain-containing protein n=1 Tax=Nitrospina watsonii TaxID=1323948 RepID=A0ABM9HC72_9BACT|nr:peptidylprolyl isomerase [Nitrospina watsonii]CAI2717686.1 PpiC domain-containing protein [Nitrospina watsonii]
MSDTEQPQEPEQTRYQRDLTAKEPKVPEKAEGEKPKKPPAKAPRKIFKPKKAKIQTSKPLEQRTRHILVSSKEAADLIRQTIVEFQKELESQPTNDPDKEFADRDKIEKFFGKFAKKYSTCASRAVGGDLEWIYPNMDVSEEIMTPELRDEILKCEKFAIPEPIRSKLGYHIVLVCESRISKRDAEKKESVDPRYEALMAKDNPNIQAPPKSMDIPS